HECAGLVARRRHRYRLRRRPREIRDEVRVTNEVVETIADVRRGIEAEQPRRRGVEPDDLVLGVEDDARVAQRARAFAHLAEQLVILLLAAARLRANLLDAREHLGPQPLHLEKRDTRGPLEN